MEDMPTIARKRQRLREFSPDLQGDLSMKQAIYVFGVMTNRPIIRLIETGKLSADKATGEWCIDAASVDRYLTQINEEYSREFMK